MKLQNRIIKHLENNQNGKTGMITDNRNQSSNFSECISKRKGKRKSVDTVCLVF